MSNNTLKRKVQLELKKRMVGLSPKQRGELMKYASAIAAETVVQTEVPQPRLSTDEANSDLKLKAVVPEGKEVKVEVDPKQTKLDPNAKPNAEVKPELVTGKPAETLSLDKATTMLEPFEGNPQFEEILASRVISRYYRKYASEAVKELVPESEVPQPRLDTDEANAEIKPEVIAPEGKKSEDVQVKPEQTTLDTSESTNKSANSLFNILKEAQRQSRSDMGRSNLDRKNPLPISIPRPSPSNWKAAPGEVDPWNTQSVLTPKPVPKLTPPSKGLDNLVNVVENKGVIKPRLPDQKPVNRNTNVRAFNPLALAALGTGTLGLGGMGLTKLIADKGNLATELANLKEKDLIKTFNADVGSLTAAAKRGDPGVFDMVNSLKTKYPERFTDAMGEDAIRTALRNPRPDKTAKPLQDMLNKLSKENTTLAKDLAKAKAKGLEDVAKVSNKWKKGTAIGAGAVVGSLALHKLLSSLYGGQPRQAPVPYGPPGRYYY